MNRILIENLITKHEGVRVSVYTDTTGHLTIGIGWNLDSPDAARIAGLFGLNLNALKNGDEVMTQDQVDEVFDYQLNIVIGQANQLFPNFLAMPDTVQAVVCDVIFNMGLPVFREFVNTIAALKAGDWKLAAAGLQASKWFYQVPNRARDDISILEAV